MTPDHTHSRRGFTLLEVTAVAALSLATLVPVIGIVTSATDVAEVTRTNARVHVEHLRNLSALAGVLAAVDAETLDGFAADDTSTRPAFQRVTDENAGKPVLTAVEYLEWRAGGNAVPDVPAPGAVYLGGAGPDQLIADRVPQGGFQVRRDGRTLVVTLTTFLSADGRTELVTGSCAVTLRN